MGMQITCGETAMIAKFDIFKRLPDGHPLWVNAVDGLEEARAQLVRLCAASPGEYFIYCSQNQRVVASRIVPPEHVRGDNSEASPNQLSPM
jgi:hypothetical protein